MSKESNLVEIGDVFLVPIDSDHFGLGQAVTKVGGLWYFVFFEGKWKKTDIPKLEEVIELPVLFASLSNDAKIYHGHWQVIGNIRDGCSRIKKPAFKVHYFEEDAYYVENMEGDKTRKATDEEVELLTNRFSVTPAILEKALQSHNGNGEWQERYERLKYCEVQKRSNIRI
jgi:hypothetical protein